METRRLLQETRSVAAARGGGRRRYELPLALESLRGAEVAGGALAEQGGLHGRSNTDNV